MTKKKRGRSEDRARCRAGETTLGRRRTICHLYCCGTVMAVLLVVEACAETMPVSSDLCS